MILLCIILLLLCILLLLLLLCICILIRCLHGCKHLHLAKKALKLAQAAIHS